MNVRSGNNKKILHKINKLTLSTMACSISFMIGKNAVFNAIDIIKIVLYASIRKLSVEGSSEELMALCKDRTCSPDVVQRRIKWKSESRILEDFKDAQEKIYSILRKMRIPFSKVTIAIDFTDKLYYGNKNDRGVVGTKHQRGTSYCFRYITLSIVIGEAKIALIALPVKPFSDKAKLVDELLTWAERKVRISLVLLDRGFFTKKVIKVLEKHQLKFLLPVPKNKLVKKTIREAHKSKELVTTYEFKQKKKIVGSFTIFFVLDPDCKKREIWKRYHAFGTNLPVNDLTRENIAEVYRKRWGIETSYRVEKHDFLAETTSKSYEFRLFLFLVALILYNFWMILRCIIGEKFYARRWKTSIYVMLYSSSLSSTVFDNDMEKSEGKTVSFDISISVSYVKTWCFWLKNRRSYNLYYGFWHSLHQNYQKTNDLAQVWAVSCESTEISVPPQVK